MLSVRRLATVALQISGVIRASGKYALSKTHFKRAFEASAWEKLWHLSSTLRKAIPFILLLLQVNVFSSTLIISGEELDFSWNEIFFLLKSRN